MSQTMARPSVAAMQLLPTRTRTYEERELDTTIRYHAEEIAHWTDAARVVVLIFDEENKLQEEVVAEARGRISP